MSTHRVRPRTPADVPVVVELLLRQQPRTRYPYRDPLPVPPEQFVQRAGELAAWVAVLDDGRVAGHVAALAVPDDGLGRLWSAGADRDVADLGAVSVLVVDEDHRGHRLATALMETCEGWLAEQGRTPVLEVLGVHAAARELYRRRGWRPVGSARPAWLPAHEPEIDLLVLPPVGERGNG